MLTPALQSRFCKPFVLCYTGHIKQSTILSPVWQCDSKGAYHHQAVHQQYYNIQNNKCRPNTLYIVQTNSGDSLCKMAYPTLRIPSNSCLRQIGYKERPGPKLSNLPQSSSGGFDRDCHSNIGLLSHSRNCTGDLYPVWSMVFETDGCLHGPNPKSEP